ncbi:MAG TPA: tetratricopeptide repeat protein [Planctomycetaceae bacterium]|jgi:tetratricopeptide (TPR) repeat protein|nr:tetratricopeptide repeat protein [Planctomycetaceae bacterium]
MAFWGVAMACGPHINDTHVDFARAMRGWVFARKALVLAGKCTPLERALIEAVGCRYADPPPENRRPLDEAYAAAMVRICNDFPDDAEVGALAADSLLDLRPWDQWTLDGKAQPGTEQVIHLLTAAMRKCPAHPLAFHLFIHAVEASPHPEMADSAADRLRDLTPALGHLLHMPSHIDMRRGRWSLAEIANEKAIQADARFRVLFPDQRYYGISIMHEYHSLAYAAMMQGKNRKATDAIQNLVSTIPKPMHEHPAEYIDGYLSMPYEAHLRFGRWSEMLAEPKPGSWFPYATAMWHYGRGIALAAQSQVRGARVEQHAFLEAQKAVPQRRFRSIGTASLLSSAERMLAGEIDYRDGKLEEAVVALREATQLQDGVRYTEPPIWFIPARHALGAVLLRAGRAAEAEAVYRDDLSHYPENGWALYGLARSLAMQGKKAQARTVSARFEKAWKDADFRISSSCCCLPLHDQSTLNGP